MYFAIWGRDLSVAFNAHRAHRLALISMPCRPILKSHNTKLQDSDQTLPKLSNCETIRSKQSKFWESKLRAVQYKSANCTQPLALNLEGINEIMVSQTSLKSEVIGHKTPEADDEAQCFGPLSRIKLHKNVKYVQRVNLHFHLKSDDFNEVLPPSPRTKFIESLVQSDISSTSSHMFPTAVIIRHPNLRNIRDEINLSYQGIGDHVGLALSRALPTLPALTKLNIRDNRLTDVSLGPILLSLRHHCSLRSLDISQNKMDTVASAAMGQLLADPGCLLLELCISNADVDDVEAALLISQLRANGRLTQLDLSHNQIGAFAVNSPSIGAEAITNMLRVGGDIKVLNLSWNIITPKSATRLFQALSFNETLVELDLSYNNVGDGGGIALGGALSSNKSIRRLKLSNSNISPRAAFTLAAGCYEHPFLEELILTSNPIGKVGGHALLNIPINCGSRIALSIDGCDLSVEDKSFTNDPVTYIPREPGDSGGSFVIDLALPHRRAIGMEIIKVASEMPGYLIEMCSINGANQTLEKILISNDAPNRLNPFSPTRDGQRASKLEYALSNIDELWLKYDLDSSGTLNREEVASLLRDLKLDSGRRALDRIFAAYDSDGSGLLEMDELEDFLQTAVNDEHARCLPRTTIVLAANKSQPFVLPMSGKLSIRLGYNPGTISETSRTTSSIELKEIISLASKTDDRVAALQLALGRLRLQVEQAQELTEAFLQDKTDVVQVIAIVLPFTSSPNHAQILVAIYLRDNSSGRRRLEKELGPAFRPLMGYFTGFFQLDLSKANNRFALLKLVEINSQESNHRRQLHLKDTSQRGSWNNFRNEMYCGKQFELKTSFFEALPTSGALEFDYVSTSRPLECSTVISDRRFISLVRKLGWVRDTDASLKEMLKFLDHGTPCESRVLDFDELAAFDREMAVLRGNKDIPPYSGDIDVRLSGSQAGHSGSSLVSTEDEVHYIPQSMLQGLASPRSQKRSVRISQTIRNCAEKLMHQMRGTKTDEMYSLRDMLYTRWFTCRQASWILQCCPLVQRVQRSDYLENERMVELAIYLFPRITDLNFFDIITGSLPPRDQAKVIHRLGWLNIFNPQRADIRFALDMREREDRMIAKILVHMSVIEPGENVLDGQFSWDRCSNLVPGWALSQTWFKEDGMPEKGSLKIRYFSGHKQRWADRTLRTALMDMVLASPLPSELQAYRALEHRSTIEYIANSLNEGCIKGCGVPIAWCYDN